MSYDRFEPHFHEGTNDERDQRREEVRQEHLLDDLMLIQGQKLPCRHLAPRINGICTKCGLLMEYIPKEKLKE